MTVYQFTSGPKEFNETITAQAAGEELARIRAEHGHLTPLAVVAESMPDDAPLHPAFEWRDDVAAEGYRLIQAKDLIKTVQVIRADQDESKPEPAYVQVTAKPAKYEAPTEVAKSPQMFESAFLHACERLRAAERAVEQLQQIAKRERPDAFSRCGRAVYVLRQLQTMLPGSKAA